MAKWSGVLTAGWSSCWVLPAATRSTDADFLAKKVAHLRIFNDDEGKMNRSLMEEQGSALRRQPVHLAG